MLRRAQGDRAGAQSLYERVLAIREKALGPEHPETAESLLNLALLRQTRGDLAGAQLLYERALAIRAKALGPEHPETAESLFDLASLRRAQGDLAGAQSLYERALAIREKALGPEHPARSLVSLRQAQAELAKIQTHPGLDLLPDEDPKFRNEILRTVGEEWLHTPNVWLAGHTPEDLLGTPSEFQVRDILRSVMVAALS